MTEFDRHKSWIITSPIEDKRESLNFTPVIDAWKKKRIWKDGEVERIEKLLYSRAYLEDDYTWRPVRPIGKGGFGVVTLWHQMDVNGRVADVSIHDNGQISANIPRTLLSRPLDTGLLMPSREILTSPQRLLP